MTEEIELEKLRNGLKQCIDLVAHLLEASEILLKQNLFASSVSLAIIALEEISKANVMRLQVKKEKGLPISAWKEMSEGRKAHKIKLSILMFERKKGLETKSSQQNDNYINEINRRFGFPELANHQEAQIETTLLERIFAKLNVVKQDCFYLNFKSENKDWINFESRFDNQTKKAIATFLITFTRRTMVFQKFLLNIPSKSFDRYTKEEWNMALRSESRKELELVLKNTNTKEISRLIIIALLAIDRNY